MKKIFLLIFVVLLTFTVPFCTYAVSSDVNFDNTDNAYLICEQGNIKSGEVFGVTAKEFEKFMDDNNMMLYGTDNKNVVFNVSCNQTDFSKEIADFANYNDNTVLDLAKKLNQTNQGIIIANNVKYVVVSSVLEDNAEFSNALQYITVKNGNLYVFTVNFINSDNYEDVGESLLNRLILTGSDTSNSSFLIVALIVIILLISAFVIYLIFTLIKDLKK